MDKTVKTLDTLHTHTHTHGTCAINKENRIVYIDLLRIICNFSVIVLHVTASKFYMIPVDSIQWGVTDIFSSIVRFSVPVFVMISGVFLLNLDNEYTMKKLYKKILKLLILYIFWSAFYAIFFNIVKCDKLDINLVIKIGKDFLTRSFAFMVFVDAGWNLYVSTSNSKIL